MYDRVFFIHSQKWYWAFLKKGLSLTEKRGKCRIFYGSIMIYRLRFFLFFRGGSHGKKRCAEITG